MEQWIDNADSYKCPRCNFEVSNPNEYRTPKGNTRCPSCGWEADDALDAVNHPAHYTSGKIEVWDFIKDQNLNYDKGCAIKYICRAGKKDPAKEIEDLEKAVAYIQHEIKGLKDGN